MPQTLRTYSHLHNAVHCKLDNITGRTTRAVSRQRYASVREGKVIASLPVRARNKAPQLLRTDPLSHAKSAALSKGYRPVSSCVDRRCRTLALDALSLALGDMAPPSLRAPLNRNCLSVSWAPSGDRCLGNDFCDDCVLMNVAQVRSLAAESQSPGTGDAVHRTKEMIQRGKGIHMCNDSLD